LAPLRLAVKGLGTADAVPEDVRIALLASTGTMNATDTGLGIIVDLLGGRGGDEGSPASRRP